VVVSVGVKAQGRPWAGEHSRDERKWTLRRRVVKNHSVVKTRSVWSFWDESARCLMTGWAATGVEGAWIECRLLRGTAGTSRSDAKGEAQAARTARREYRSRALGRTDP